jgi:hypothetical protein
MGQKKDVVKFSGNEVSTIFQIKQKLSEQLHISLEDISIKLKGKLINDDQSVTAGMKLMGVISTESKPKIAPPPTTPTDINKVFDEFPTQCPGYKKKCSFYGRKDADGFCSVCYKARLRDEIARETGPPNPPLKKAKLAPPPEEANLQSDKTKCWECKRRIGLLGFECKCGYKYCGIHRYPEQHQCKYDYKKHQRDELANKLSSYAIDQKKVTKL